MRKTSIGPQWALLVGILLAQVARAGEIQQEIIDPEDQNVISSSYYPVVDASPKKAVDSSGLSSPLNNADAVPTVWPTHDTLLSDMYWSGVEVAPSMAFTLPGTYAINSVHYWNYNEPASHGSKDGPANGVQNITIQVSTGSVTGPYTTVGSYQFLEAPGNANYTGVTLPLGTTVVARYVKFQVLSDYGGDASGLAEVRFIGGSQPGDLNLDGKVGFDDLLTLAQHYGTTGATLATGDLNHDGVVTFDDLLVLAQNYGQSLDASSSAQVAAGFSTVPEPASLGLVLASCLLARRRR